MLFLDQRSDLSTFVASALVLKVRLPAVLSFPFKHVFRPFGVFDGLIRGSLKSLNLQPVFIRYKYGCRSLFSSGAMFFTITMLLTKKSDCYSKQNRGFLTITLREKKTLFGGAVNNS